MLKKTLILIGILLLPTAVAVGGYFSLPWLEDNGIKIPFVGAFFGAFLALFTQFLITYFSKYYTILKNDFVALGEFQVLLFENEQYLRYNLTELQSLKSHYEKLTPYQATFVPLIIDRENLKNLRWGPIKSNLAAYNVKLVFLNQTINTILEVYNVNRETLAKGLMSEADFTDSLKTKLMPMIHDRISASKIVVDLTAQITQELSNLLAKKHILLKLFSSLPNWQDYPKSFIP